MKRSLWLLLSVLIVLVFGGIAFAETEDFIINNGVLERYVGTSENVVIPNTVTSIGQSAFSTCNSLKSVIIPETVTDIGAGAFNWCPYLEYVSIPDSIEDIKLWTFMNCDSLESITLPASIKEIHEWAFMGCINLSVIYGAPGSYAEQYAEMIGVDFKTPISYAFAELGKEYGIAIPTESMRFIEQNSSLFPTYDSYELRWMLNSNTSYFSIVKDVEKYNSVFVRILGTLREKEERYINRELYTVMVVTTTFDDNPFYVLHRGEVDVKPGNDVAVRGVPVGKVHNDMMDEDVLYVVAANIEDLY